MVGVSRLPPEEALSRGINFVAEAFVLTVSAVVLVVEVWRNDRSAAEKAKKAAAKEEEFRKYLDERFSELDKNFTDLEKRIRKIEAKLSKEGNYAEHEVIKSRRYERNSWLGWLTGTGTGTGTETETETETEIGMSFAQHVQEQGAKSAGKGTLLAFEASEVKPSSLAAEYSSSPS